MVALGGTLHRPWPLALDLLEASSAFLTGGEGQVLTFGRCSAHCLDPGEHLRNQLGSEQAGRVGDRDPASLAPFLPPLCKEGGLGLGPPCEAPLSRGGAGVRMGVRRAGEGRVNSVEGEGVVPVSSSHVRAWVSEATQCLPVPTLSHNVCIHSRNRSPS